MTAPLTVPLEALVRASKWECREGTPDEDHNWRLASDWYGDPGVISGTCTYYVMRCRECGAEREATEQEIADSHNDCD